jgi:mRNA-degrading endonuclease RelE of RelBE toxin-antitoxin system
MEFRIADTFTDSLARLTAEEQKSVKTTAFDLQLNPANPGMSFHKLDKARDKNFWSVRASDNLRIIVHKTNASLLLCYVDHHDKAYDWAERRKLETHPKTGAAQLVEIRETVQEIRLPVFIQGNESKPKDEEKLLFANTTDEDLLKFGVPIEWLNDVRQATEETLLALADHLPGEAAEALLELATGGKPRIPQPVAVTADPFDHPDAQRRFRVMTNVEELQRALDAPWEKWTVFLHPEQRQMVEQDYAGPVRISGSAGTGKTIVALHRAVYLARTNPEARILLTTFSYVLANTLQTKLRRLVSNEPKLAERIDVYSIDTIGNRLYKSHFGEVNLATTKEIFELLSEASKEVSNHKFSIQFLHTEWDQVVDAWQLESWEAYRDVTRLGRKTRLSEQQRVILWSIFDRVRTGLTAHSLLTHSGMFSRLAPIITQSKNPPFEFTVVDEAQDISISQLKFLSALGANRPNALFFAGDLGQRIFQQPFSWKSLGIDIRGRNFTLRVNYRTSHQIRMQSDRLLEPKVSDVDGNIDDRSNTVSVFNGPDPIIRILKSEEEEQLTVRQWISDRRQAGIAPHEIGVFIRSTAQIDRARAAVEETKIPYRILDEKNEPAHGQISICTMHLAKGLEFRAVVIMACDDEVIPLQERIETIGDDADLQEVYDTERHLLYVACTRARDDLLITSFEPASEFLDDLRSKQHG